MRLLRDMAWLPPCLGDSIWTHRHHFFAFPYFLLALFTPVCDETPTTNPGNRMRSLRPFGHWAGRPYPASIERR